MQNRVKFVRYWNPVGTGNMLEPVLLMCLQIDDLQAEYCLVDNDRKVLKFVRQKT